MRHHAKLRRQVAALLLAVILPGGTWALPDAGRYLAAWKEADANDPAVVRAKGIFERVRRVADRRGTLTPRLIILNSPADPWAIALPDSSILLSRGALEVAFKDADSALGDARLAFVLGHELAHLAKDDFWHQQVYLGLMGDSPEKAALRNLLDASSDTQGATEEHRLDQIQKKEIQADDYGFIYSALAGYPVTQLLGTEGNGSFFEHWMQQTHTRVDRSHPAPQERATMLEVRLHRLSDQIELFRHGVRLAHFGLFHEAEALLSSYARDYPGRELANNLGVLYLRQGLQALPEAQQTRWALPVELAFETRAPATRSKGGTSDPNRAQRNLRQAVDYFQRAIAADPSFRPAIVNLAISYLLLDEVYHARAQIEDALKLALQDLDLLALRALIAEQASTRDHSCPMDLASLAERVAQDSGGSWRAGYNLARLWQDRGDRNAAMPLWEQLADVKMPAAYARQLCAERAPAQCGSTPIPEPPCPRSPWSVPLQPETDLLAHPADSNPLEGWSVVAEGSADKDWQIFTRGGTESLFVFDGFVKLAVHRGDQLGTVHTLITQCGAPDAVIEQSGLEVWSYGDNWAVVIRQGTLEEAWLAAKTTH